VSTRLIHERHSPSQDLQVAGIGLDADKRADGYQRRSSMRNQRFKRGALSVAPPRSTITLRPAC
jgi:hypothetical protein